MRPACHSNTDFVQQWWDGLGYSGGRASHPAASAAAGGPGGRAPRGDQCGGPTVWAQVRDAGEAAGGLHPGRHSAGGPGERYRHARSPPSPHHVRDRQGRGSLQLELLHPSLIWFGVHLGT